MGSTSFRSWLEFGFNESINECKVNKPVILLKDGARCHISIEISEYCDQNEIIFYVLYPNATHVIVIRYYTHGHCKDNLQGRGMAVAGC